MRERLQSLAAWHGGLEGSKRTQLYGAVLLAALAIGGSLYWASYTPHRTLLSGRAHDEILDAAAALQPAGIPYRIEDDGSLSVPLDRIGEARAALNATSGLPSLADVGELRLGLTPRAQSWAFLRAREGDIARMINGIAGVSSSRVAITPRVEALFADEEQPARASVFLKQRPGHTLERRSVDAIVNLVANSVEGLTPDSVSVVDERGTLLSEGRFAGMNRLTDPLEMLEYQSALENRFEQSVRDALDPLLGFQGGFSVTATVDLERASEEVVAKQVDAEKQALLSEQLQDKSTQETRPAANGVPGVDANLPERPAEPVGTSGKTESSAITANYIYPTVDTVTHRPSGALKRLSVAVQVDSARIAALAEASEVPAEDIQSRIQEAVKAAIGFDEARTDQVSVSFVPFAEPEWIEETGTAIHWEELATELAPWAVGALGILLGFLYVIRPLVRSAVAPRVSEEDDPAASDSDDLPLVGDRLRAAVEAFEPVDRTDLNRLAYREAESAAQVLRLWTRASGE